MATEVKPVVRIRFAGTVASRHEADALLKAPGDVVLVERGRLRSIVFACPDGCGTALTINLDERAGPAWRLYSDGKGLTLYPSVWRDSGCEAHFVLWHDRIVWCGRRVEGSDEPEFELVDEDAVFYAMDGTFRTAVEIADRLKAIPWEVSRVCERLSRRGDVEALTEEDRRRLFRLSARRRSSPGAGV